MQAIGRLVLKITKKEDNLSFKDIFNCIFFAFVTSELYIFYLKAGASNSLVVPIWSSSSQTVLRFFGSSSVRLDIHEKLYN